MYIYTTTVRLQDTDATGVLYFSQQLKLSLEAFEQLLKEGGFSLRALLTSPYLLPIVHVESDYKKPLRVDDEIEIRLHVEKIGTSSFTIQYQIWDIKEMHEAGSAKIVHVVMLKETGKSTPIPEALLTLLHSFQQALSASVD